MDPKTTLADIRRLVTEAKNEEAANRLLQYLDTAQEPQRSWRDTVGNLLAQYKRIRQQRERGTVSFDDARLAVNQITDGLLAALAGIEEGLPAPSPKEEPSASGKTPWLAIGVVIALVLAGASFLMLRNSGQPTADEDDDQLQQITGEAEEGECPTYDKDSEFNILVLPFLPLDDQPALVDRSIRLRLGERMEKYGVRGNVFSQKIDYNSDRYPLTSTQAADLARPCNAQLIIWGTTEKIANQGQSQLLTTTKFRFIKSDKFMLTDLELSGESEVDTVTTLSSIATSAELTEELERSLRLIFGLVAHETENYALAAELLDTVIMERGGVADNPKWGRIQADSYIKSGQDRKAIEVLDKMLSSKDTVNVEALLQRGLLEYRVGESVAASKDLNKVLEHDPDNEKALTARAAMSVKRNDLFQADQDLNRLEQMNNRSTTVKGIRESYRQREQVEQQKLQEAEQRIERNPNDTAAWRIKAESANSLGQFRQAESAANNLLSVDPKNIAALSTLQSIARYLPDSVQIKQRVKQSLPRLSPQQLRSFQVRSPE